jgi:hypothetical protein
MPNPFESRDRDNLLILFAQQGGPTCPNRLGLVVISCNSITITNNANYDGVHTVEGNYTLICMLLIYSCAGNHGNGTGFIAW